MDKERFLVLTRCYNELIYEAHIEDEKINLETKRREEQLELEEEAIIEARREAARVMRLANSQQEIINPVRLVFHDNNNLWEPVNDNNHNGNENDDVLIDTARLGYLTSRTYLPSWNPSFTVDTCSTISSGRERSQTNGTSPPSSVDLEWENETGLFLPAECPNNWQILDLENGGNGGGSAAAVAAAKGSSHSTPGSTDLEWDHDNFSPSPVQTLETEVDVETENLIQEIERLTNKALQETGAECR